MSFMSMGSDNDNKSYLKTYNREYYLFYIFQMLYIFAGKTQEIDLKYFLSIKDICFDFILKNNVFFDLSDKKGDFKSKTGRMQYINDCYNKIRGLKIHLPDKLYINEPLSKSDWATPTWFSIHTLITLFSNDSFEEDCKNFSRFLHLLQFVLPCNICRGHLKENLKSQKVILTKRNKEFTMGFDYNNYSNKMEVFLWSVAFHISVNLSTPERERYVEFLSTKDPIMESFVTEYGMI